MTTNSNVKNTTKVPENFDEFDEINYPRPAECDFDNIVETAISRRGFMGGVLSIGSSAFLLNAGIGFSAKAHAAGGFIPITANSLDTITLPAGFNWHIVSAWGDPLWSNDPPWNEATRGTGKSQERSVGGNNDGMAAYEYDGHTILAMNNEYVDLKTLHGNRDSKGPETDDDVLKNMNAHGITIFELGESNGQWQIVKDSQFNRRITPNTEMEITGPARGHQLLQTSADQSGTRTLGTWNNCGSGPTPWGTYLTCEENFNGYFSSSDENVARTDEQKRYGIGVNDWGYGWRQIDKRFDISKEPNEANRAGYVVEIDPKDAKSTPKKRTALGRFKHENAETVIAGNGHVVVYMGDDERGEFLYRFVSSKRISDNDPDILDDGQLFVAKFNDNGRGEWIPLTEANTGMTNAEICIHSRVAGSKVGATTMDRPEWVASNPNKAEVYCALTNNKNRGVKTNAGGDEQPVGGPNPREANKYGQIVRWNPDNSDHTANGFTWDLYVLAGNPTAHSDSNAGSSNVNAGNMFNSPDGIAFDTVGRLWIQTDGNYSNEGDFAGMGNNQMLVGDTETGEIRRFLVGPREAEITGLCWSADLRTMFVGVQHPGERGDSHFPGGGNSVPRSCFIAVQRDDGGQIG